MSETALTPKAERMLLAVVRILVWAEQNASTATANTDYILANAEEAARLLPRDLVADDDVAEMDPTDEVVDEVVKSARETRDSPEAAEFFRNLDINLGVQQ